MKLCRIITTDKSEFKVTADKYMTFAGRYIFYIDGKPIPNFFLTADIVLEIIPESGNSQPASQAI